MEPSPVERDKCILLTQLPEVVWRAVVGCIGDDFPTLETCSEVNSLFHELMFSCGQLSIRPERIMPSVFRELTGKSDGKDDSRSEPTLLLLKLTDLKPRITTFDICINRNFRPDDEALNSFLKLQNESLETFYISCLGIESNPLILQFPEVNKLRVLKMVRSVKESLNAEMRVSQSLMYSDSILNLAQLQSLTLSVNNGDEWEEWDFSHPRFYNFRLKHLRFLDYITDRSYVRNFYRTVWDKCWYIQLQKVQKMVSLEIPTIPLGISDMSYGNYLKQLSLTVDSWDKHKHSFDSCITGYSKPVCAAILQNPERDPVQIREEIEEERKNLGCWDSPTMDTYLRREGLRYANITELKGLEVLRIKCMDGIYGPTIVSCFDLLSMRSLKTLDFCKGNPKYIPADMMAKFRDRFTVFCG